LKNGREQMTLSAGRVNVRRKKRIRGARGISMSSPAPLPKKGGGGKGERSQLALVTIEEKKKRGGEEEKRDNLGKKDRSYPPFRRGLRKSEKEPQLCAGEGGRRKSQAIKRKRRTWSATGEKKVLADRPAVEDKKKTAGACEGGGGSHGGRKCFDRERSTFFAL